MLARSASICLLSLVGLCGCGEERRSQTPSQLELINAESGHPRSTESVEPQQETLKHARGYLAFDRKYSWRVVSRECDGQLLLADFVESFRFDHTALERTLRIRDDDAVICDDVETYDINVQAARLNNSVYAQEAFARVAVKMLTCIAKEGGIIPGDPTVTTLRTVTEDAASTKIMIQASRHAADVMFHWVGHPDCPYGTLAVALRP